MRGKVQLRNGKQTSRGITPAYAGKSRAVGHNQPLFQDHPRVCGEKVDGGRNRSRQMGSPPRMRGKGIVDAGKRCGVGITPAYAGKSQGNQDREKQAGDHPRVCGEKA